MLQPLYLVMKKGLNISSGGDSNLLILDPSANERLMKWNYVLVISVCKE